MLVDLYATELEERLGALDDPPHARSVEPLRDHVADGTFDGPRADLQVEVEELVVVHEVGAGVEIPDGGFEARTLSLVAWPSLRNRVEGASKVADDRLDLARIEAILLLGDPSGELLAPLPVEAAARLPEVLDGVDHVQGDGRIGEELSSVLLEHGIAVEHELDALARRRAETTPCRVAPGDLERVSLPGIGGVDAPVDRTFEALGPARQLGLFQRVHDDKSRGAPVLRVIALLPPPLLLPVLPLAPPPVPRRVSTTFPAALASALLQLVFGRRRRCLRVDHDHQRLAVVGRRRRLLEPRLRVLPEAEDRLLDRPCRRRPAKEARHHEPRLGIAHLRREPRDQADQVQAEAVNGELEQSVERIEAASLAPHVGAPVTDRAEERRDLAVLHLRPREDCALDDLGRRYVESLMAMAKEQGNDRASEREDERDKLALEVEEGLPRRKRLLGEREEALEQLAGVLLDRVGCRRSIVGERRARYPRGASRHLGALGI